MIIPQPTLRRRTFLGGLIAALTVATTSDATKLLSIEKIEEKVAELPEPIQNLSELVITPGYGLPQFKAQDIAPNPEPPAHLAITNTWGADLGHADLYVIHELTVSFDGASEDARTLQKWMMRMIKSPWPLSLKDDDDYIGRAELIHNGQPIVVVEDIFPTAYEFQTDGKMKAVFRFRNFHQQVLT